MSRILAIHNSHNASKSLIKDIILKHNNVYDFNDKPGENKTLDHSFDFNSSTLVRNTFPHKVNDPGADYDFFNESYESFEQISVVRSVTQGDVEDIEVIEGGTGYRIGERLNFDETVKSGS